MIKLKKITGMLCVLTITSLAFIEGASAQKYTTPADTVKLNKEYGELTLDVAKLNAKLIAQQNKTAGYESKTASTAQDAVNSAQDSKNQAATATNGTLKDAKKAVNRAKKANSDANSAQNAKTDQTDNIKDINALNYKIGKLKLKLADLSQQKAAIIAKLPHVTAI